MNNVVVVVVVASAAAAAVLLLIGPVGFIFFLISTSFVMLTAGLSCLTGVYFGSSGQILCRCPPGTLASMVCNWRLFTCSILL